MQDKAINPVIKLTTFFLLSLLVLFTASWESNYFLATIMLLDILTTAYQKKTSLFFSLIGLCFLSLTYFVAGLRFASTNHTLINHHTLEIGLQLSSRCFVLGMIGLNLAYTVKKEHLMASLVQQAKLPMKIAYSIYAALHLAELMKEEYRYSKIALQMRGINPIISEIDALFAMMVRLLRWSDSLAIAMECRGFSEKRILYNKQTITKKDWLYLLLLVILTLSFYFLFGNFLSDR